MLQIDDDDQGVLQVHCSEGKDSEQGILDWLGVFPNVQVNIVYIEYVKEDEDDEWSDSSKVYYTLKMQEFSIIRMSDHMSFHFYVERAMTLSKVVRDDSSQEQQIEWVLDCIEDKYKIMELYQDQLASLILVVMFALDSEMKIALRCINN